MYLYTAIVYLSTYGVDFTGGELAIVDGIIQVAEDKQELADGVVIEPIPGRLVLFSAGAENMHTPLKVKSGSRAVLQMWFTCQGVKEVCKIMTEDGRVEKMADVQCSAEYEDQVDKNDNLE
eukprot:c17690_g1_i1.p2 GENE.c17690_g1_i1~~c17690_g1_i1.p2  ORF type:complete len:121 (+),score=27.83 c17690_g1_i1:558-920(+)